MLVKLSILALMMSSLVTALPTTKSASWFPKSIFGLSSARKNITIFQDTQNDLLNGMPCKPVTVIYARGTWAKGNIGDHVGPSFVKGLAEKVGVDNIAIQGVDYKADIPGFFAGGDGKGSEEMRELTGGAMNRCPKTQVVLAGYSQGAQLVHKAVDWMHEDFAKRVSSVIMFGDPKKGQPLKSIDPKKVKTYCHADDLVCQNKGLVGPPHWDYRKEAKEAVKFSAIQIKKKKGFWKGVWDTVRGH